MFSARTGWGSHENRLTASLRERRQRGLRVADLTESNPTRAGLKAPPEVLALLGSAGGRDYDPHPAGAQQARQAVATDFLRRGVTLSPDQIVLTASSSEAYAFLFKLLLNPGECVLVPSPSYPLFEFLATLESVEVHPYPLRFDGEWHVDLAALRRVPQNARAIVVVNPNNPTGSFVKEEEVSILRAVALEHGLALISDEVFSDYVLRDVRGRVPTLGVIDDVLTFCLGGLSKSCGLPQLKLGWIGTSGPADLKKEALARLEIIADTYLSVATPIQLALPHILPRLHTLQAPIQSRIAANLAFLEERVAGTGLTLLPPEGGWSAVVRLPATLSEEEWALSLLNEDGVLVHPGFFFDLEGGVFVVLSLLCSSSEFEYGLEAIRARVA